MAEEDLRNVAFWQNKAKQLASKYLPIQEVLKDSPISIDEAALYLAMVDAILYAEVLYTRGDALKDLAERLKVALKDGEAAKKILTVTAALEITIEERDQARQRLEELGYTCRDEGCPQYNTPHSHHEKPSA